MQICLIEQEQNDNSVLFAQMQRHTGNIRRNLAVCNNAKLLMQVGSADEMIAAHFLEISFRRNFIS